MNKAGLILGGIYLLVLVAVVVLFFFPPDGRSVAMWALFALTATNIPVILLERTPLSGLLFFVVGGALQWYAVGCLGHVICRKLRRTGR